MLYLSRFEFPTQEDEVNFRWSIRRTCYDSWYPFGILSQHGLKRLDFEPITILYGGNGSGKSTALNVICEKLQLARGALYNRSSFYEDYLKFCTYSCARRIPKGSQIITSDDVFDFMLDQRSLNEGVDRKRDELLDEYMQAKYSGFKMHSIEDYEQLKNACDARSTTQSKYVRSRLMENVRTYSNGESAFRFFVEKIKEDVLVLLDEPENSLSPARQLELLRFLEDSVRFYGCQFIIATHSPFLLAMKNAKIYDLDADPVDVKRWSELENVKAYYRFFKEHEKEFIDF